MNQGIEVIIYPVKDLAKARTLYSKLLGVEPYVDQPYYVGFKGEGPDIGLDPHGHSSGLTGPVSYWRVADIHESLRALIEAGAEAHQEPRDVGGGKLIASVRDADGNILGLSQPAG
ncbi:MAG: hypothetical protein QOH93_2262 [Chloroflexia bacterium]|jgi:predicted enzyme related to lactoylglutathione lyase|nr:hypothetical protein [Chloroflexia bacterium]